MYPGSSVLDDAVHDALFFFSGLTVWAREFLHFVIFVIFVKNFVSVVLLTGTVVLLRFPPRGPLEHTCFAGQGTGMTGATATV